jgi:hypothetical protein
MGRFRARIAWLTGALLTVGAASCSLVNAPDDVKAEPSGPHGNNTGGSGGGASLCGNGAVDDGETCDGADSCPTECDAPTDACMTNELEGSAETCDAKCTPKPVTACTPDDGCCPSGCSAPEDTDCPVCGNGVVEAGETCDGECATTCSDGDACTQDAFVGTAATCNVVCSFLPITSCVGGDGCCAPGCTADQDGDCTKVVIVNTFAYPSLVADVQGKQKATGAFAAVDTLDVSKGLPKLADLEPYDVTLVFADAPWPDAAGLGNVLADYYDGGGRVVLAPFATTDLAPVAGRFGDPAEGYLLMTPGAQNSGPDSLGTVAEPDSPLMKGVSTLQAQQAIRGTVTPLPSSVVVAQWASGTPLVVRGTVQNRNRVDLNLFPGSKGSLDSYDGWTGNGTQLIRNALLYH